VSITKSKAKYRSKTGGRSSAGRAPALHAGGQEFDPPRLHQYTRDSSDEMAFTRELFDLEYPDVH